MILHVQEPEFQPYFVRSYSILFCFQFEVELDVEEYATKIIVKIKNLKVFFHMTWSMYRPSTFLPPWHTPSPGGQSHSQAFVTCNEMDLLDPYTVPQPYH